MQSLKVRGPGFNSHWGNILLLVFLFSCYSVEFYKMHLHSGKTKELNLNRHEKKSTWPPSSATFQRNFKLSRLGKIISNLGLKSEDLIIDLKMKVLCFALNYLL